MRQQQGNQHHNNKNRSRGRSRKPGNGLSRNYESNGPDVKIRGNASHVADKYQNLARDALTNGDTVMAENYYQHAEHYNRIVAAAQLQAATTQETRQPNQQRGDEQSQDGDALQPSIEGTPAEVALGEGAERPAGPSEAGDEENPRRRNTRSRRPRKSEEAQPEVAAKDETSDQPVEAEAAPVEAAPEPVKKVTGRRKPKPADDGLSDDAAMLPSSITGGASAGEEVVAVED